MVDPVLLVLSRFVPGVVRIVHGQALFLRRRKDRQNRGRNQLRRHGGPPAIPQQAQTDISVCVNVLVNGHVLFQKEDRRRNRRIVLGKLDAQLEDFSLVNGALGAFHGHNPESNVGSDLDRQIIRRRFEKGFEFLLDPVIGVG